MQDDFNLIYFRMCRPLQAPLHPLVTLLVVSILMVFFGTVYGQNHIVLLGEE